MQQKPPFSPSNYYLVQFLGNFTTDLAIWNFFFTEQRGLSLAQAATIHSWSFLIIGLTDLPTGVVADYFGRRISALIGFSMRALGSALTVLVGSMGGLLIATLGTALGWSLVSGTLDSLT